MLALIPRTKFASFKQMGAKVARQCLHARGRSPPLHRCTRMFELECWTAGWPPDSPNLAVRVGLGGVPNVAQALTTLSEHYALLVNHTTDSCWQHHADDVCKLCRGTPALTRSVIQRLNSVTAQLQSARTTVVPLPAADSGVFS